MISGVRENLSSNFGKIVGDAGKSGKDSADAYLKAFEEELKELQSLRDSGEISEKEYLDRLRVTISALYRSNTIYKK